MAAPADRGGRELPDRVLAPAALSAGPHGDSTAVDALWRAVRGRVAMVLSGHEHNMQRLRPDGGTVQFVSGAGGFSHTEPAADDPRLAFGDGLHDGALRLRLRPGRAEWAFVATDGRILDDGVLALPSPT